MYVKCFYLSKNQGAPETGGHTRLSCMQSHMSIFQPVQGSRCVGIWWPRLLNTNVKLSTCSGIRVCQKLVASPAMQSVGAEATDPPSKLCGKHRFDTDDYWACMVRRNVLTNYHPCGTCKMGPTNDKSTVVDPQLRYGVVEENTFIGRCFLKKYCEGRQLVQHIFSFCFPPSLLCKTTIK